MGKPQLCLGLWPEQERQIAHNWWAQAPLTSTGEMLGFHKPKCQTKHYPAATFTHIWWKCKMMQPLWQNSGSESEVRNTALPFDPASLPTAIYSRVLRAGVQTTTKNAPRNVPFCSQQLKGRNNPNTHQWVDKHNTAYPCCGILFSHKKESKRLI